MKNNSFKILIGLIMILVTANLLAQDVVSLAKRIVNQTAGIKPGDVVLVEGGKHTISLMEQIAVEVHRQGAHPLMMLESDLSLKAYWHEKPEANLSDYPKYLIALFKEVDFVISLPNSENFKEIYKGVDPKRSALIGSNSEKLLEELSTDSHSSSIGISFPTKQIAELSGIDFGVYEKMHWAAANTDYKSIADKGEKLKALLKGAKSVKISTKEGTNLTFSMGDRLVFADDGILSDEERSSEVMFARYASLPGGWMDFAPMESSVNGTIMVSRMRCDYEPMLGVSFTVKNGVIENFQAKQGQGCFDKNMAPHTGNKNTVSVFTLGLNPEMKVIQNDKTDYRPNTAAGFMTIAIGGNNKPYNGTTIATGGYTFPIINPTLEIDGKVVVKDGKIVIR